MKRTQFILGCIALVMASCASPEERAAAKLAETTATEVPATNATTTTTDTTVKTETPATATTTAPDTAAKAETPVKAAPAAKATEDMPGKALIAKEDCLACHSIDKKIVGPAYANVAVKYPANDENIETLSAKIIAGGSGVWGAIPMTPHPTLSKSDAKEMVKYILSLKK